MARRVSRKVKIGDLYIGGDAPVAVQSMLNAPASDFEANLAQLKAFENAGCEILRMAVPEMRLNSSYSKNIISGVAQQMTRDRR